MKYDYVFIDADTPGNSHINITILNASAEASEVGFSNETIWGFKLRPGPDLSVLSISPVAYPKIRIQVNLVAAGPSRPTINAWSLYFLDLEIWRDDLRGTTKMSNHVGLNFTGSALEVNLTTSKTSGKVGAYKAYPPMAVAGRSAVNVLYSNAWRNDYLDAVDLSMSSNYGTIFEEINGDGYIDLVAASAEGTSKIFWGTDSGIYSDTAVEDLSTPNAYKVASGDFNGDGWYDLAFACWDAGSGNSLVYLNKGNGTFDSTADLVLTGAPYADVKSGDINNDGFDDVLFSYSTTDVYFGSSSGVDGTSDETLPGCLFHIGDMDGDGIDDVLIRASVNSASVYLGKFQDFDSTADHTLMPGVSGVYGGCAGDINGDGYVDIVLLTFSNGYKDYIHEGASDGWSDTRTHSFAADYGVLKAVDVDKDGYDDIIQTAYHVSSYCLDVYKGSISWPSSAVVSKAVEECYDVAVAIPSGGEGARAYGGTIITEAIRIPTGKQWDVLYLKGDTPRNTSITVSVLDSSGTPILGYRDLAAMDVDLGAIDPVVHNSIKVRVTLTSEFNNTTPTLDFLTVKWMDKMVWRDEFFGPAKVGRMLNMAVTDEALRGTTAGDGPQLLVTSLRSDEDYNTYPLAYMDAGNLDYLSTPAPSFNARGSSAVDVADANGDGYLDMVVAVHQTSDTTYDTMSYLYWGTPVGLRREAFLTFPTTGASDVLLRDLNADGYVDVVFAQELKVVDDHTVNSTLFWGTVDGWAGTPDVQFVTRGATGVTAADMDGDGRLDLAFACYKDGSTSTDSMVFLQTACGFDGSAPNHRLPTRAARGVAAGDIDGDGRVDLVFANSQHAGLAQTDSYVYWGKMGYGFAATPAPLPTMGAQDVEVADVDCDGDLDVVFANRWDDSRDPHVSSYVYLNDGSGGLGTTPAHQLCTVGAVAVTVADLDGKGWKDLVFACLNDGTTYDTPSLVYLGTTYGWATTPDIELPTVGATDVAAVQLFVPGSAGYVSRLIAVDEQGVGTFHAFRYDATLGGSATARLSIIDADTWEVLAGTAMVSGDHDWALEGLFRVREHPRVRVQVTVAGLDAGSISIDDLWMNWTVRVKRPPRVLDLSVDAPSVYRLQTVTMWVNVIDEYNFLKELDITIGYRLNGTEGAWEGYMVSSVKIEGDTTLRITIKPLLISSVGFYDFRIIAQDTDSMCSNPVVFACVLEVLNNLPTAPVVRLMPESPVSTANLRAEVINSATDLESSAITYIFRWYRNGVLLEEEKGEELPSIYTKRGENWSVEVRAFDGEDEGHPALAWVVIANAPPLARTDLPDPELEEDIIDTEWLDLSTAFKDPDEDPLSWSLASDPIHLTVTIDPATGRVTLMPDPDWYGDETLVFVASDGELTASQEVTVHVLSVNDLPVIATVDGEPVTTGTIEYTIRQGQELLITYVVTDVEGDETVASVTTRVVDHDEAAGTIRFAPGNGEVGTLTFTLRVNDIVSPDRKVTLDFVIVVENENDPMGEPRITNPLSGTDFKANQSFSLIGMCDDPDVQFGQVLNFTWSSNISGVLDYGSSITARISEPGTHLITLRVSDPDYNRTTSITIVIEATAPPIPPPPPEDDDEPATIPWGMIAGVVAAIVIAMVVLFVVTGKRRTEAYEARMDAEEEAEEKREALERTRDAIKGLADKWEGEVAEGKAAAEAKAVGWVAGGEDNEEVSREGGQLSMEARVTEAPSADVAKLWAGISDTEVETSEDEREALRLECLKRKYQNAIGRLPYGIPSKELQGMDWVDLANALATAEKKNEGGKEVTLIDGRWYYSDHEDSRTFLKEHGAMQRAKQVTDREKLLSKLEERFILGEISEETYKTLHKKYKEKE